MQRIGILVLVTLGCVLVGWEDGAPQDTADRPLRIGYVNVDSVLAKSTQFKVGMEQMLELRNQFEEQVRQKESEFQEKMKDYENKRLLLSEERRQELEEELGRLQGEGVRFAQEKEQELAQRDLEVKTPIFRKVREIIDRLGAAGEYDLILQQAVYVGPAFPNDLTDRVIGALNEEYQ